MSLQELFTKVTGLTWDVNKLTDEEKKKWLIPDGAMLDGKSEKLNDTLELLKKFGLSAEDKIELTEEEKAALAVVEEVLNSITNGETNITVPEGSKLGNIEIPAETAKPITINGEILNGSVITNSSTKSMTLNNTGEPVDVTLDMKGEETNGTVNLKGEYNNVTTDSTLSSTGGILNPEYATIHGDVNVDDSTDKALTLSVRFSEGEEHNVNTESDFGGKVLTINNKIGKEQEETEPSLNVNAPNASVTLGGKFDNVSVVCSDNTLKLASGFHANKLEMKKGRLLVESLEEEQSKYFDELVVSEEAIIEYAENHVTASNTKGIAGTTLFGGKVIVDEDIVLSNKGITTGATANTKEVLDLNGHSLSFGTSRGCMLLQYKSKLDVIDSVGGGKFINNAESYGIWTSGEEVLVNIYAGDFEAYTHVLYAERGTINIYGGTFKLLGIAEVDDNGQYKFLLNCLDASYKSGIAKINVFGGKFYNFNPANNASEGVGTNYVADGYKVVESEEDGVKVFEVVKED